MQKLSAVRRGAMAAVLLGAPILISGCAMSPQTGQIIQAVVGLLGAAAGQGGGPLAGPVTAALPQAPGGTPGGAAPAPAPATGGVAPGGNPAGPTTGAANDVGERVKQAAYNLPDPFPYKPGTDNGNLGCADVVSTALEGAGVFSQGEHDLAVAGVQSKLKAKGWAAAPNNDYKDGDVIIWGPTSGGTHKHIGIIVIENGQTYAINNSSSQKKPVKTLLSSYNRGIDEVLRNPGSVS